MTKPIEIACCTGTKAIADYLGKLLGCSVSERTVHRWMRSNGLPCRKVGGWVVSTEQDLEDWVAQKGPDDQAGESMS